MYDMVAENWTQLPVRFFSVLTPTQNSSGQNTIQHNYFEASGSTLLYTS